MSTLSALRDLWVFTLWITTSMGCTESPSNPPLPESVLETENWLQTSRKVRYVFDINTQWQGWILHSSDPEQIAIALFTNNPFPTSVEWTECVRRKEQPPSLWLSATVENLAITKRYARQINDSLPIVEVQC